MEKFTPLARNFTLPPGLTGWTNFTSVGDDDDEDNDDSEDQFCEFWLPLAGKSEQNLPPALPSNNQ